jgi:hypothetical protein
MTAVHRVALVLFVDVHGDVQDPHNWAEAAVRRHLATPRLGLPAPLDLPERVRDRGIGVVAVGIHTPLAALQSGALDVVVRQPAGAS